MTAEDARARGAKTFRQFGIRRDGWRWVATFTASDGLVRPLPSGLRYWRRLSAEREALTAGVTWNDALWACGNHPLQQEAGVAPQMRENGHD